MLHSNFNRSQFFKGLTRIGRNIRHNPEPHANQFERLQLRPKVCHLARIAGRIICSRVRNNPNTKENTNRNGVWMESICGRAGNGGAQYLPMMDNLKNYETLDVITSIAATRLFRRRIIAGSVKIDTLFATMNQCAVINSDLISTPYNWSTMANRSSQTCKSSHKYCQMPALKRSTHGETIRINCCATRSTAQKSKIANFLCKQFNLLYLL